MISRAVRAAVATGENLTGLEQFRPLIQAGAVDVLQTGSVWGITHFLRVAALAHAFDLPVSPVGYNANPLAHAAASIPNHLAIEVQDLTFLVGLTVDQEIVDGSLLLGDSPGWGTTSTRRRSPLADSMNWWCGRSARTPGPGRQAAAGPRAAPLRVHVERRRPDPGWPCPSALTPTTTSGT
ncbi:hypothetical protein GCM10027614_81590 [Micromonospora vulcania]